MNTLIEIPANVLSVAMVGAPHDVGGFENSHNDLSCTRHLSYKY